MIAQLVDAWNLVFTLNTILMIFFGTFLGITVGAIPGLTATMAMAILSPITFFMSPVLGIPFLLGIFKGGLYGGSISAILVNTPGTASAAATVMDGYPLAQKGKAIYALTAALKASIIGDLVGTCILVLVAPQLAKVALKFGPPEIFALILFSITVIALGQTGSLLKAWIATVLGLCLAVIGQDPITGYPRFAFGILGLKMGIEIVSLCIGLFGLSEILIQSEKKIYEGVQQIVSKTMSIKSYLKEEFKFREAIHHLPLIIQSSIIGVVIGILPGIGSETSCWMAYTTAKKRAKNPEQWGTGVIEGVLAPETANNIECGTALIPLLTFGIPGDAISAMMLGAFIAQGLRPGPELFLRHYDIILALFITMYFATIAMYVLGHGFIFLFARILNMKRSILYAIVFAFCVAGTFAIKNNLMDVITMFFSGFLGYGLRKFGFPLAPVAIGFILGGMFEVNFRQGMIMGFGSPLIFFLRPISASFLFVTLILLSYFIWGKFSGKGEGIRKT